MVPIYKISNWQSTLKDIVFDKSKLHSIRYNPYVRNHSLKDFFDFCPYDKLKIIKVIIVLNIE